MDPVVALVNVSELVCPLQIGQHMSLLFVAKTFLQSTNSKGWCLRGGPTHTHTHTYTHTHTHMHTNQAMLYIQVILSPSGWWLRLALRCPFYATF